MGLFDLLKGREHGNNATHGNGNSKPRVDDSATRPASSEDGGDGPVLRLQIDLYKFGRARAISSGALQAREADIRSLKEHAEAMARETKRDIYDPKKKQQHRLRENEYEKILTDRAEAEDSLKFSAAAVREREQDLARLPQSERPHASLPLMWGLVVGIAATIAPTVHDALFSTLEDEVLAWFFSLAGAGFLAAVVVWSILGSISATGRRTTANWAGLAAGITISVGLGLFRLAGAANAQEIIFAVALTLIEVGLVVLAEWVAVGLREHFREWNTRRDGRDLAEAALSAAKGEHERRLSHVATLNEGVKRHIEYVEDLDLRNVNLQELIDQAVKAIIDGYNDGIAYNRGHVVKAGR